ncbi:MAG: dihydropteroate synthase, partial [Acidobacteriota bacterium]|nr:dihydropteroate synthase [Acidobacteriota bacterium]
AAKGLDAGISVLNDVTGFSDPAMLDLARHSDCGLIAMRSRMQAGALWMPDYSGAAACAAEAAVEELRVVRDRLLHQGIASERILLDPGFGFGTTFGEDLALWGSLPILPELLAWPVERFCIGISRKRFLAWRNGTPELPPQERDGLTREAHDEARALGYRVFRTHELP